MARRFALCFLPRSEAGQRAVLNLPSWPLTRCQSTHRQHSRSSQHEQDLSAVRSWLSRFSISSIPPAICIYSFSRSSGPGGQNVNKLSSKATLKVSLEQLLPLLPPLTHQALRNSRYYARSSNSIIIQADESRRQSDNSRECLLRLHRLICDVARAAIPGETSEAQKERVKKLQASYQKQRLQEKKHHSMKKRLRRISSHESD